MIRTVDNDLCFRPVEGMRRIVSHGRWMLDEGAARGYRAHEDNLVEHRNLLQLCFLGGDKRGRGLRRVCRGSRFGRRLGCGVRLRSGSGKVGSSGSMSARIMPVPSRMLSLFSQQLWNGA